MALRIRIRAVNDVSVLELSGRLVLGEEASSFRATVNELLSQSKTMLVLDLENLTYIDSSGLRTIVAAFLSARRRGGSVKLSVPPPFLRQTLQLTKLYPAFETFPSTTAAVQSFAWYNCARHGAYVGPPPCRWRITKIRRPSAFGISLDNAFATDNNSDSPVSDWH